MWMDGALMGATFFIHPCPWANQGGELKLPHFFSFPQPRVGFFLGTFFSSAPTPAQVSPAYLHLDYLPMHPGLLPTPSACLPTYVPMH
jgi:hypothetical protein